MGRIVAQVTVANALEPERQIRFDALVDTGASLLVLPRAWKDRLGELPASSTVEMETADQRSVTSEVCGPVRIEVEGFRPIYSEVAFLDMHPADGTYEPLLGYVVLEQAGIAVDMLGHRLVKAKHMDLK
jgi:predicted aspartyl protease